MLDSQTLALMLSGGLLWGIYAPSEDQDRIRALVRARQNMAKDKLRSMARIRAYINRSGLSFPSETEKKLWTRAGQRWLEERSATMWNCWRGWAHTSEPLAGGLAAGDASQWLAGGENRAAGGMAVREREAAGQMSHG